MPLSRGYGSMASMHIALTNDDVLFNMMKEFTSLDITSSSDMAKIPQMMSEIFISLGRSWRRWSWFSCQFGRFKYWCKTTSFYWKIHGRAWMDAAWFRNIVGYFVSLDVKRLGTAYFLNYRCAFWLQGAFKDIFQEAQYDFVNDAILLNTDLPTILSRIDEQAGKNIDFITSLSYILYNAKSELGISVADINSALSGLLASL